MQYAICLGSNSQRKENLKMARQRLKAIFPDIQFAHEEETYPLYLKRQDMFSNQVACFHSTQEMSSIIAWLKSIERDAGRIPEEKEQEIIRLDIDLLMCDTAVLKPEDIKRDYISRGLHELGYTIL